MRYAGKKCQAFKNKWRRIRFFDATGLRLLQWYHTIFQDDAENESRTWKPDPEVTTCASMNSFDDSVLPDLPEACCFEVAGKIARLCYTFHICTPISSSASRRYLCDMTSPNICQQFMRRCDKDPGRHRKRAVVLRSEKTGCRCTFHIRTWSAIVPRGDTPDKPCFQFSAIVAECEFPGFFLQSMRGDV